jgi:transposase
MSKKINQVGIDVSSKTLVVEMKHASDNGTATGEFDNTSAGHKKLLKFITKYGRSATVCMEATGNYHFEAALLLAKSGKVEVMIVNPKAMHHFGVAILQRAKTDSCDAHIILEYLLRMEFKQWAIPSDNKITLHRFARRLAQLKKMNSTGTKSSLSG